MHDTEMSLMRFNNQFWPEIIWNKPDLEPRSHLSVLIINPNPKCTIATV